MLKTTLATLLVVALSGCTSDEGSGAILGRAAHFEGGDRSIGLGQSVVFRMVEGSHTVDFAEGDAAVAGVSDAHSGNLNEGETFTVTFTQAGTYHYFCRYHSGLQDGERVGMVGTITVV